MIIRVWSLLPSHLMTLNQLQWQCYTIFVRVRWSKNDLFTWNKSETSASRIIAISWCQRGTVCDFLFWSSVCRVVTQQKHAVMDNDAVFFLLWVNVNTRKSLASAPTAFHLGWMMTAISGSSVHPGKSGHPGYWHCFLHSVCWEVVVLRRHNIGAISAILGPSLSSLFP